MGLEPWWIFIFTVHPRNKIHRYQETSLISFLKPTKRGTSRKKVTFQKKKSILCDLKKKNAEAYLEELLYIFIPQHLGYLF